MLRFLFRFALAAIVLSMLTACSSGAPPTPNGAQPSTPVSAVRDALSSGEVRLASAAQPLIQLPTAVPQSIISAADAEYLLLENLYTRLVPSIVNVEVTVNTPGIGGDGVANGSGFVYGHEDGTGNTVGYIVTNAHVVQEAAGVRVTFHDGYVADAEIVGADAYSDIAILRVQAEAERLIPVTFADSSGVRVGQRAIAIGNPFGLSSSMTVGIVSALGRQLPSAELINSTSAVGSFNNPAIIQVDAEINPGNSGGPLLNSAGELIGVNTAIRTESGIFEGVGFAVPANTVARVVPELIDDGTVDYAWLGISAVSAESGYGVAGLAESLNLPVTAGVLIDMVTPGSPAAAAGLRGGGNLVVVRGREVCAGGDIVVSVDGQYVRTMDELVAYLVVNSQPGDVLNLLIIRGDDTFEVPVTLAARPAEVEQPRCGG